MHKRLFFSFGATCAALFAGYLGCSGDSDTGSTQNTGGAGVGGMGGNGGGNGGDIFSGGSMNGGNGGVAPCAEVETEATLVNRPVDIIVAIDNSGSMSGEIAEVEAQMTRNFASILDGAVPPIDYRVILVSRHGENDNQSVCIAQPLGSVADADMDGHCDDVPDEPADTAKFFHHSVEIDSHDSLCQLIENYDASDEFDLHPDGYKALLRDDSLKFFLVITDDNVDCSFGGSSYDDGDDAAGGQEVADLWDTNILALSPLHFGTAMMRNYRFWSIVALAPYNETMAKPYGDPQPPDGVLAPITDEVCPNSPACNPSCAEHAGTGYQALSIDTGGYRYPTCPVEYSEIFTLMAQGVIEGAQVPCEIAIPDPPSGMTIDLETLEVDYGSDGSLVESFGRVAGPADCDAHSFYIEADTIVLCPEACAVVQVDENAELSVRYQCGGPPQ
jgi:hypothetical protein